jgi:heme/copper-type cytochrome/quinol oxidase subunit 2
MTTMMWLCVSAALVVFGVILHSVATFRGGSNRLSQHTFAEIGWALIPILIMIAAALPSLRDQGITEIVVAAID